MTYNLIHNRLRRCLEALRFVRRRNWRGAWLRGAQHYIELHRQMREQL